MFVSDSALKNISQLIGDGSFLVFDDLGRTTQRDLWVLPLRGDRQPVLYLSTPFNEALGAISPDGRWMLYVSDESGHSEIYVQSFPTPGTKTRISTDGGTRGAWRDDGAEILYESPKGVMSVAVGTGATFTAGEPKLLMGLPKESGAIGPTADFQRLLLAMSAGDRPRTSLTLLTNWTSLLEP